MEGYPFSPGGALNPVEKPAEKINLEELKNKFREALLKRIQNMSSEITTIKLSPGSINLGANDLARMEEELLKHIEDAQKSGSDIDYRTVIDSTLDSNMEVLKIILSGSYTG